MAMLMPDAGAGLPHPRLRSQCGGATATSIPTSSLWRGQSVLNVRSDKLLRRSLIDKYGTYIVAWRRLFDRAGCGRVLRADFAAACRSLRSLPASFNADAAFDVLITGEERKDGRASLSPATDHVLVLHDLDPEAASLITNFADFIHAEYGTVGEAFSARVPSDSRQPSALDFEAFMHACMEMGYTTSAFRSLFDALDFEGKGRVSLVELKFLQRWLRDPPPSPSLDEALLLALERHGPLDEVCRLVSCRADPNIVPRRPAGRSAAGNGTALIQAAERGKVQHVQSLLSQGADPSLPNGYGYSALHRAAVRPQGRVDPTALVQLLHMWRGDLNAQLPEGSTPLHLAAGAGRAETVATLCYLRADVEARDFQCRSPLFLAVYKNCAPMTKLLLEAMADPCREDRNGKSVISWAAESDANWDKNNIRRPELVALMKRHARQSCQRILPSSLDAAALAAASSASCGPNKELRCMKLTDLKRRARQEGVDLGRVESLDCEADPRQAVIRLILENGRQNATEETADNVHALLNCYVSVAKVPAEIVRGIYDAWNKNRKTIPIVADSRAPETVYQAP